MWGDMFYLATVTLILPVALVLHGYYIYIYGGCTSGGVYVPCILKMYLSWSSCTVYIEDVPVAEFMYVVPTRMPDAIYRSRVRSLLW